MNTQEEFKLPVDKYNYVLSTLGFKDIYNNGITDIIFNSDLSWFTIKRINKCDIHIEAGNGITAVGISENLIYLFGKDNNRVWIKAYQTTIDSITMVYSISEECTLYYRIDQSTNQDVVGFDNKIGTEFYFEKIHILPNCTIKVKGN